MNNPTNTTDTITSDERRRAERVELIRKWKDDESLSFQEIAHMVGVGQERVKQLYAIAKQNEVRRKIDPFFGLNERVRNVLMDAKITTVEELRRSLISGQFQKYRNIGIKAYLHVVEWLGGTVNCPHCGKPIA